MSALAAFGAIFFWKSPIVHPAPRLTLPLKPMNLGQAKPGKIVDGRFAIGNAGSSPLKFKLTPSCGCSELNPREGEIGPHQSRDVHIGIRLDDYGATRNVMVKVETNDPNQPEASYLVSAACPELLRIEPERVDFGVVPKGKGRVVEVVVSATGLTSKTDLDELGIETDLDLVKVSKSFDNGRLTLKFTLDDHAPKGLLRGRTKLRVRRISETIELPVTAEVSGPIRAAPTNVFLREDPKSRTISPVTVLVSRSDGASLGPIEIEGAPRWFQVDNRGKQTGRFALIQVVPTAISEGESPGSFQVRSKNSSDSISIRVFPPSKTASISPGG